MATDKYRWVKVAESFDEIEFGTNGLAEVVADDKRVCIAQYKSEAFAFAAKCPHASGHFADGFIDALGNVVCPLHRYKFCMKNGRNVSGEGYYLKHWPVELREDGVYVGLESSRFLGLF
jgi:nitrite reductase/ring-hydroxylating ferredoxin subunit